MLVAQGIGLLRASDQPLQGETTHYYTLFSFAGDPPVFPDDPQDDTRHNRAAAMALSPYDFGGLLYSLLPAIYHRYDAEKGQLRRFLDLPGAELDRLYNHVRVSLELIDPLARRRASAAAAGTVDRLADGPQASPGQPAQ
ncbi:putative Translation initiation factor IF-2 [Streptomyces afghaniensis 772]|uniref:Putative Translation initiation factor IF-2 n=1 Tax=Streptomyces afghaniensis 772 TaxID=1283301 RepID=S4MNL2_9ACTN|nr:putative Translation initiation factor IF-2 [Streptomyces afghaniensis 772]